MHNIIHGYALALELLFGLERASAIYVYLYREIASGAVIHMYRALLEAQEIFGLDFDDPNEFARMAEEGLGSEEEEEEEDEVSSE